MAGDDQTHVADNDNLWAALGYAHDAPDPSIAIGLASLGWYFALVERVSEGRRCVELALAAAAEHAPLERRVEVLAFLCYLATEELDLDAAIEAGERGLALGTPAPLQLGLLQSTLPLALARIGGGDRAAVLAAEGWARVGRSVTKGERRDANRDTHDHRVARPTQVGGQELHAL